MGEGVYSTTSGELALDSGPASTRDMMQRLKLIAEKAKAEKLSADEIIAEIADVNPELAAKLRTRFPLPAFVLLIVLFWIVKSFSLNLSVDVNRLVDQAYHLAKGQDPQQHVTEIPPLPTSESQSADAEGPQPKKESRQVRRQKERQTKKPPQPPSR